MTTETAAQTVTIRNRTYQVERDYQPCSHTNGLDQMGWLHGPRGAQLLVIRYGREGRLTVMDTQFTRRVNAQELHDTLAPIFTN